MTTLEKLFEKILRRPKEVRYEELKRVLTNIGYVLDPGKGSHMVYRHERYPVITVPFRSPVKRAYVRTVQEVLEIHLGRREKN